MTYDKATIAAVQADMRKRAEPIIAVLQQLMKEQKKP